MEERVRTRFGPDGLILSPRGEIPFWSGSIHYWRIARSDWAICLDRIKQLGLAIAETYVPWGVHAPTPGRATFTGGRDLGAFIDAVDRAGMKLVIRPGPHINAELTWFGFPRWLLERRDLLAVSGRGTPMWLPAPPKMFPVPSYASAAFRREVAAWFEAVGTIVGPRRHPDGPVVAVQVDNETQMFFRLGAYDGDYHPDALAWWREEAGDAEPPRAWDRDDAERCLRWVKFKTHYMERSLAWLTEDLITAGMGEIARFHNAPPAGSELIAPVRAGRAIDGVGGADFYHRASDAERVRRRALCLVGSSSLPMAPEVGIGGPPWLLPMSERDSQNVLLGLLAAGLRAFNLYMAIERDRWYGAAFSPTGQARPIAGWLTRLIAALREADWTSLRRRAPVAVVMTRAESDAAIASSAVDPLTPVVAELLGLDSLALDTSADDHARWQRGVLRALDQAQIPYAIVDEDADVELASFPIAILVTVNRVTRALWQRVHAAADAGTRVVVGPNLPGRDELDLPLGDDDARPRRAGLLRPESLDDLDGLVDDLTQLCEDHIPGFAELPAAPDHPSIDCAWFEAAPGEPRLLFVGNRSPDRVDARVELPEAFRLADPLATPPVTIDTDTDGTVDIPIEGYQVRMFRVTR